MVGDNPRRVRPAVQPRTGRTRIPRLRRRDHTGATRLRHAGVAAAALHGAAVRVVGEDGADRVADEADLTGKARPLLGGEEGAVGGVGGGHQLAEGLLVAGRGGGEQRDGANRQAVTAHTYRRMEEFY